MIDRAEFDQRFDVYRNRLQQEITRLASYARVYRLLQERTHDRLREMNIAPAFFQITSDALYCSIIIWLDKMLDERSERGLFNFLAFIEHNRDHVSVAALQERNGYADDHWMLDREEVSYDIIERDRAALRELKGLDSIRTRRDKFQAHFDKEYFFAPERISDDAPLSWKDLDQAIVCMHQMLNFYSSGFDGKLFTRAPMNVEDVNRLLDVVHRARRNDS